MDMHIRALSDLHHDFLVFETKCSRNDQMTMYCTTSPTCEERPWLPSHANFKTHCIQLQA